MREQRMEKLARTFPSLNEANGLTPWASKQLAEWASQHERGSQERISAQFVLWICDPCEPWQCGRFNLLEALATWDEAHREAFVAWVKSPWWG